MPQGKLKQKTQLPKGVKQRQKYQKKALGPKKGGMLSAFVAALCSVRILRKFSIIAHSPRPVAVTVFRPAPGYLGLAL